MNISLPPIYTMSLVSEDKELYSEGYEVRIGRKPYVADYDRGDYSMIIFESPYISRLHAVFKFIDNEWFMEDMLSKNGTWLNGTKLDPNKLTPVKSGDKVKFADTELFFKSYMDKMV